MKMDDFGKMIESALNAMTHVMNLHDKDRVLIVMDHHTARAGEAFRAAAEQCGCAVEVYEIPNAGRPLLKMPAPMKKLVKEKTVVINAFKGFKEETPFRLEWINAITASKTIRLGHSPNITETMMTQGPMNVDYPAMLKDARRLMGAFVNAKSVRITAPGGTDVSIGIEDRGFSTDVLITEDNPGNLPCGEIWCGPQ
ncbi:MAG: hypothetical protein KJ645_00960 [Planctomycetes bacterium]|nr:hypothetical protein [Planctomycetota bacterium]